MDMTFLLALLLFSLLNTTFAESSHTIIERNGVDVCRHVNIFKRSLLYQCYLFRNKSNINTLTCCKLYISKRKKDKKDGLLSLQDIVKNSINEADIYDIKNLFPLFNEKLLKINKDQLVEGEKGKRVINDIDDLLIEFNNKYFNLKDIKVNIISSKKGKSNGGNVGNGSNDGNDGNYFNFVKEESNFMKKKEEVLQNSPFYSKTCFKSIHGKNCWAKKNNKIGNYKNGNINVDVDVDEDLDYDLMDSFREEENIPFTNQQYGNNPYGNNTQYNDNLIANGNTYNNDGENFKIGNGSNKYDVNAKYGSNDGNVDSTSLPSSSSSSFFSFFQNFSIVNIFSRNPRKIMQKHVEFKEHLSGSKENLENFLDKEYYSTTQKISSVLTSDIKKTTEFSDGNERNNKGFLASVFDDIISLFYFPKKNVEL
ncbi:conserved Plasmodium protein, unknown function [Plasmodium ovale]|uniref:Uncharacterized protein n=1 Tax=Plasmodium ovale TaxID=36330 RepID=A0A1D3TJ77_PLAOA|nr:conserved Plasmodium protein, unknown function [Plasmodium ovale]